eukprot:TRINITY_DN8104_c0_g1_i1.p2 TRINITY_DN8104_c0_g1~~TRINITY_DN8104_c0_g1_i1.p2  ORF type:complete len:172 (+),score=28.46 TRINITY_DN8104_c0_g1_i1:144-659(+)
MATKFKEFTVGYIDPGYLVRSNCANADDAAFCLQLANHAVHEGLNGSTGCVIGSWNDRFTAVPMKLATAVSRQVDLDSELWRAVREITVGLPRGGGGAEGNPDGVPGRPATNRGGPAPPRPSEGMDARLTGGPRPPVSAGVAAHPGRPPPPPDRRRLRVPAPPRGPVSQPP